MINYLEHLDFMKGLDDAMKKIIQGGQINTYDIPAIVALSIDLLSSKELHPQIDGPAIQVMYDFIMSHYGLMPIDNAELHDAFKQMLATCMTLTLFRPTTLQPRPRKDVFSKLVANWFKCMCIGRRRRRAEQANLEDIIVADAVEASMVQLAEPVWDTVTTTSVLTVSVSKAGDVLSVVTSSTNTDAPNIIANNVQSTVLDTVASTVLDTILDK